MLMFMVLNTHVLDVLAGTGICRTVIVRSGRRWEDNIKTHLQELGWGGMHRINLTQVRDRWWKRIFGFRKMREISRLAGGLLASP